MSLADICFPNAQSVTTTPVKADKKTAVAYAQVPETTLLTVSIPTQMYFVGNTPYASPSIRMTWRLCVGMSRLFAATKAAMRL